MGSGLKFGKRGRPSKAMVAEKMAEVQKKAPQRSDEEILKDLNHRFAVLERMTKGAIDKTVRALVVAGAPGVGKTYTVEHMLEHSKVPHAIVRGKLKALALYMLAYEYRHEGSVLLLDDADGIFQDEDALNILKALCDSSVERKVCYRSEAQALKDADIPQDFIFNGAMIFISNLDFQSMADDQNRMSPHFDALMSRSLYLELRLRHRSEIGVWVNHIAQTGRIFDREMVPQEYRQQILDFISTHRETLRELSIRTLLKLSQLVKSNPLTWKEDAEILMLRPH
jgi:hypothetical protein